MAQLGKPSIPPPSYTPPAWLDGERLARFQALCQQHEISSLFAHKLRILEDFDVVLICDDSGSMSTKLRIDSAYGPSVSRWDELRSTVSLMVSLAALLDDDGVDIYFLNRPPLLQVRDASTVTSAFQRPPSGYTPIAAALQSVLQAKEPLLREGKKLLTLIMTDGEPTDLQGNPDVVGLGHALDRRPATVYTTFVACTDEKEVMQYLNAWDKNKPRVDVVDDYESEKAEILKAQGKHFRFSRGDYTVKLMLGGLDASMDKLDEKSGKCCIS